MHISRIYSVTHSLRGAFKKKNYEILDMWQKGGGVSSSGKLFNEEKFGHVFRGGGQRDSSKVVFVKKKFVLRLPEELLSTFYLLKYLSSPTTSLPVLITPLNSLEASHEFFHFCFHSTGCRKKMHPRFVCKKNSRSSLYMPQINLDQKRDPL